MRLINTRTLVLTEFFNSSIPQYAILSHTWGQEEITFQDWITWQMTRDPMLTRREGFVKIKGACNQARLDRLDWLWVDTNCIDKTSSSELTEAINSMYIWYRDSVKCYAFLADVPPLLQNDGDPFRFVRRSKWFTRGWTLQELLAPKRLDFYANTWSRIGSKSGSMIQVIHETTGIEVSYLSGHTDVAMASVAKKMSWLSKRTTTRVEDIAYCMLGIFEINLPLLYGEGMQAFMRLQNEIIRQVHDQTIFCWTWNDQVPSNWVSMLAPSPRMFRDSGDYVQRRRYESLTHYSTTNLGLLVTLPALYTLGCRLFAVLDAGLSQHAYDKRACIPLRRPEERAMVFERVYFPPSPLSLPLFTPHNMVHYSLYALSKPTPSTLKSQPNVSPSRFGVLIFVEPTASRIIQDVNNPGSGLPGNRPLLVKPSYMSTHPPNMFDGSRDLFLIPPSSHKPASEHTLTVEVTVYGFSKTAVDEVYYMFFAIETSRRPRWHCYITTLSNLEQRKGWRSSDQDSSVQSVDRYLKSKFVHIWKTGTYNSRHESSDKTRLAFGEPLNVGSNVEIRTCFISGSKGVSVRLQDSDEEGGNGDSDNDSVSAQIRRN